jgi:hypothetical protein
LGGWLVDVGACVWFLSTTFGVDDMNFINTGVMCMVNVPDANKKEGFKQVALGNYFNFMGKKCLLTSQENAIKYGKQIDVPIYLVRENNEQD